MFRAIGALVVASFCAMTGSVSAEDASAERSPAESHAPPTTGSSANTPAPAGLSGPRVPATPIPLASLCAEIGKAANLHGLPEKFLVRLIWQESRFDPLTVSHKGAQGIAQFMPETARWRGLADPFDPHQSVHESARWLGELRRQFGNLGLAAAAYNAGPGRVQDWLAGRKDLPRETRAYVRIITGRQAEEWAARPGDRDEQFLTVASSDCPVRERIHKAVVETPHSTAAPTATTPTTIRALVERPADRPESAAAPGAWGLQLIGSNSEARARQEYQALQKRFPSILGTRSPHVIKRPLGGRRPVFWYQIRVVEVSRQSATSLCSKLRSAGGQCLVLNN